MIAIVLAVVVVAGVVAFFLLKGGGGSGGNGHHASPGAGTPQFSFDLKASKAIATTLRHPHANDAVKKAADEIHSTMDSLYGLAFLDPNRWKSGDYGPVFEFFQQGKTAAVARRDEAVLTLGPKAGSTFTKVEPNSGSLVVQVLTDRRNAPFTAAATADFTASATQTNGKVTVISSHATYYLQSSKGGWVVIGFRAKRSDHVGGGPAPSGPSGASGSTT